MLAKTNDQPKLLEVPALRGSLDSGSDQFYTPKRIRDWIGPVDLDPCADPERRVDARSHFVGLEGEDGLLRAWGTQGLWAIGHTGVAYVNPPYNRDAESGESNLARWVAKCVREFRLCHVDCIVALIPIRCSESYWWGKDGIFETATWLLHLRGRVRFENAAGIVTAQGATFASGLVVWGNGLKAQRLVQRVCKVAGDQVKAVRLDGRGVQS